MAARTAGLIVPIGRGHRTHVREAPAEDARLVENEVETMLRIRLRLQRRRGQCVRS